MTHVPPPQCWTTLQRPPRRVYIDAGANWANTLRLYDELETFPRAFFPERFATDALELARRARSASKQPWEIYAFEASPAMQPTVDKFVEYLNGKRSRPEFLVPPTGSSKAVAAFARMFN
eukprot:6320246-Prymnesium_polylepis.1